MLVNHNFYNGAQLNEADKISAPSGYPRVTTCQALTVVWQSRGVQALFEAVTKCRALKVARQNRNVQALLEAVS